MNLYIPKSQISRIKSLLSDNLVGQSVPEMGTVTAETVMSALGLDHSIVSAYNAERKQWQSRELTAAEEPFITQTVKMVSIGSRYLVYLKEEYGMSLALVISIDNGIIRDVRTDLLN